MLLIVAREIYKESLSSKAKAVFLNLVNRANVKNDNSCWPKLKTIAKDCSMSVSSVQRAINELLLYGFIKKYPRYSDDGSQTSNLYKIMITMEEKLEARE